MYWETVIFMGSEYMVTIDHEDTGDYTFEVYKVGNTWSSITIEGLSKEEIDEIIKALKGKEPKQVDDWVDCVFFSKPIAGKHAQEIFEDRLKKAIEERRCG
jgi:stress response protein SCP2